MNLGLPQYPGQKFLPNITLMRIWHPQRNATLGHELVFAA
jgi:hypothetical protein